MGLSQDPVSDPAPSGSSPEPWPAQGIRTPKAGHLLAYVEAAGDPLRVTEVSSLMTERLGIVATNGLDQLLPLIHPDDRIRVVSEHARAAATGQPLLLEFRLLVSTGPEIWVQDEAEAVAAPPGPSELRGHWLDVSRRRTWQEELLEREAHFRAVVANIPGVVYRCAVDRDWTMFYMSDYMEKLVGYPACDFIENRVRRYGSIIHPDDHPFVIQEIDRALASASAYSLEYRLIHADGRARWIAERGRVVVDEQGRPRWLDGVLLDIGRQKLAEESRDRAEEELRQLALFDALTGLPNRTLFDDRAVLAIADARREKTDLAVLMMDLDGFKQINDTFGHATGDRVLAELAERLQGAVREGDSVARLGGDEFAVLLRKAALQAVLGVVERIRQAMEGPLELEGMPVGVGVSVGIARFPHDGDDVATLLRHADLAMYSAKHGRAGHALYDASADSDAPGRPALIDELKAAFEMDQLVLHYQPKVAFRGGRVTGVEALLRWLHPTRGLMMPELFLQAAQEGGLMKSLVTYYVDEALRQCRVWADQGRELTVSVNVWMRTLLDEHFPEDITAALDRHRLPGRLLELELNAGMLLADAWRAKPVLERLDAMGVRISVDHFGASYASLATLRQLRVHEIKVDRAFVTTLASSEENAFVVRSTIDLGRQLGLTVVAEGVRDEEVWQRLAGLGCDLAQGLYAGPPVPAEDLAVWLDRAGGSPERPRLQEEAS